MKKNNERTSPKSYNLSSISYSHFLIIRHKTHIRKLNNFYRKLCWFTQSRDLTAVLIDRD
jgi:hypothetical protein